jgi:hypothetical protein
MAQDEVLYFKNRAATESADKHRNDETQEREHAGDTTAANPETLDFSTRLEFSAATGVRRGNSCDMIPGSPKTIRTCSGT